MFGALPRSDMTGSVTGPGGSMFLSVSYINDKLNLMPLPR